MSQVTFYLMSEQDDAQASAVERLACQLAGIVGDYNGNAVATNNKHSTSALTNIIYAVTPKLDVGLEYLRSERTQVDDLSGRLDRVQAHARYSF